MFIPPFPRHPRSIACDYKEPKPEWDADHFGCARIFTDQTKKP